MKTASKFYRIHIFITVFTGAGISLYMSHMYTVLIITAYLLRYILILSSHLFVFIHSFLFTFRSPYQNFVHTSFPYALYQLSLPLLNRRKRYKLSRPLCSFVQTSVISQRLGQNILLRILSFNAAN